MTCVIRLEEVKASLRRLLARRGVLEDLVEVREREAPHARARIAVVDFRNPILAADVLDAAQGIVVELLVVARLVVFVESR